MRGRPAECARGSRAWALLLLGIVLLTSPVSAQPVEQDKVAGAVPAEPSPPRENDLPGKPAPPAKVAECVATAGDWQEPERWAWQQICARQPIDFNKRYGTLKPAPAPDALAAETRRHLGADFLREIFEDPTYATHTQNAPIHIAGAYLKNVAIGDTTLGALRLFNSRVEGTLALSNVTVARHIWIVGSHIDNLRLSWLDGGNILIEATSAASIHADQLHISRLALHKSTIPDFQLSISRFSEQVVIREESYDRINLAEVRSDALYVRPTSVRALVLDDYQHMTILFLEVGRWIGESSLTLKTVIADKFQVRGEALPKSVSLVGFSFTSADWGPNPMTHLAMLKPASREAAYTPEHYDRLAKSYADAGQASIARDILIAKQDVEFAHTDSILEKSYLSLIWLLGAYGHRPEIGLGWIVAFVGLGALIFWSGERRVIGNARPDSWLIFALDSVIPGIHLNPGSENVRFAGWRQYFLYFLRFLGAVVVVLVLEFLRRSLVGPG